MSTARPDGFTLIELLITVVIITVLAAIAYPVYTHYVMQSRRSDATTSLLAYQQVLERCYSASFNYTQETQGTPATACTLALGTNQTAAACGNGVVLPLQSQNGYYELSTCTVAATTYTLTMTPVGPQADDTQCPSYTVDNLGNQTPSPSSSTCWGN